MEALFEIEKNILTVEDALAAFEMTNLGYTHKFVAGSSDVACKICYEAEDKH